MILFSKSSTYFPTDETNVELIVSVTYSISLPKDLGACKLTESDLYIDLIASSIIFRFL